MAILWNSAGREKFGKERTVGYVNAEVILGKSHAAKRVNGSSKHLDLGKNGFLADDVAVPLVVFTLAPLCGAFIAEALRNRIPLEREAKFMLTRRDHTRKSGRHLGTKREVAVALVVEMVNLLTNLFTGLAGEKLVAFNYTCIIRNEPCSLSGGTERIKHSVAPRHILRIEIPHAARRLKTYFAHLHYSKIEGELYHIYSCRNASIGSRDAARKAGYRPNTIPIPAEMPNARTIE